MNVHLLVIDPQFDFCDASGALFVAGADKDMNRLAKFVKKVGSKLSDISVTLDSHHLVDIAHPIFWMNADGKRPDPFTIISASDVENGVWRPRSAVAQKRALAYVKALEANARYPLCIWPPHCLIGSDGHKVYPSVFEAMLEWEDGFKVVEYVTKGSNPWTEHYSAVQADVPDPEDPTTQVNTGLINRLMTADQILIAGEAGSHCLANTVRDVATNFGDDSYVKKLVLLEDATSPVPTFEQFQEDFIAEMTGKGMQVSTTKDWA